MNETSFNSEYCYCRRLIHCNVNKCQFADVDLLAAKHRETKICIFIYYN